MTKMTVQKSTDDGKTTFGKLLEGDHFLLKTAGVIYRKVREVEGVYNLIKVSPIDPSPHGSLSNHDEVTPIKEINITYTL